MANLLQSFETFDLWEEELHDVENFTKFVFGVYYEHHWQSLPPIEEVESCVKEPIATFPDFYYLDNNLNSFKSWE